MAEQAHAIPLADLNIVECPDDAHWERWLHEHHASATDAWVKIAKKGSGVTTVHYPEVLDTAICFGWIDGVRRPLDDTYFLQRFTPRGPRSKWSQVNREKALALTARGGCARRGRRRSRRPRPTAAGRRRTSPRAARRSPTTSRAPWTPSRAPGVLRHPQGSAALRVPLPPAQRQDPEARDGASPTTSSCSARAGPSD